MLKEKTAVYISSIDRPKQLAMAVNSVPEEYRVIVHCHDKEKDACVKFDRYAEVWAYPEMSRNDRGDLAFKILNGYNILQLNDDVKIFSDTIRRAEEKMFDSFGSSMGVCGIKVYNVGHIKSQVPFAFCLYGNEWINQFIDRKMANPAYEKYYVDYEWWVNATMRGCWTYCEEAQLIHDHRFKCKNDVDTFYIDTLRDKDIFVKRCEEGKCWGITEGCHNPIEKCEIKIVHGGEK